MYLLVIAATTRNHWTESNNTEPHTGNTPFYQSQGDHSGSRKGVTTQTARMSRSSSGAPENPSFLPETSAEGRNKSSSRGNVPVLHAGRSPEITTTLTDDGSSSCECIMRFIYICPVLENTFSASFPPHPHIQSDCAHLGVLHWGVSGKSSSGPSL